MCVEPSSLVDVLSFIQRCVRERKIPWTYHANMRLIQRFIPRSTLIVAADTFEIIEEYPQDKYLPSYLILGEYRGAPFHTLIAADALGDNVRIMTAYDPDRDEWNPDLRTRRRQS